MVTLDEAGRSSAHAVLHPARGRPSLLVEHAFVVNFQAIERRAWKVVPDTAPHLMLHLRRDGTQSPVALVGARTKAIEVDVSGRVLTVGVRLRPGALPVVAGLPASDFTDRAVPATEVWGRLGETLDARVRECGDPAQMYLAMVDFLGGGATTTGVSWVATGLDRITSGTEGAPSVRDIASRLGMAPRTLRQRSMAEVGIAPKRFARVARLLRTLRCRHDGNVRNWAAAAAANGFVDQAHLTRDFRDLLGESPGRFAARAAR